MKRLLIALALLALPVAAHAQTQCPTVTQGQTWTVQQWNACFGSLAANSGGTIANAVITGGSVTGAVEAPAGGIGTILTVNTGQQSLAVGVSFSQIVVEKLASPAAASVILPA